ncbi:MAG: aldo/keto reductase [Spirochaetaceae bacterium]|nr:aldo/keto reductase [Spirochaetaceae bacterium]
MEQAPLGRTGRTISRIALGTTTFGREIDEEETRRILDYAVEHGLTLLDTAEAYGGGNARLYRRDVMGVQDVRETTGEVSSSERMIGTWMRDRGVSDQVTVLTKVSSGNSPDNIERALNASLERLQLDSVPIYMVHNYDDEVPLDETMDALNRTVADGRAQALGCSNFTGAQLRDALAISAANGYARMEIVENIYNLARPEEERDSMAVCADEDVTFLAYSPLGAGFLAGKYTADRDTLPERTRFHVIPGHCDVYFSERNFRVVEKLRAKAAELGESMVYLAASWVVANRSVGSTLFGARTIAHLDNALRAYHEGVPAELHAEMSAWD